MNRRRFIQSSLAAGAAGLVLGGGLLLPGTAGAKRQDDAFAAGTVDSALLALFGDTLVTESTAIEIEAPELAGDGKVVQVSVNCAIDQVASISLLVERNFTPLCAHYVLLPTVLPYVSTYLKMYQTSDLIVVAAANGKRYSARRNIKITNGGCDG